jgi:hypothetical protein
MKSTAQTLREAVLTWPLEYLNSVDYYVICALDSGPREPMSEEQRREFFIQWSDDDTGLFDLIRAVERYHGIGKAL